MSHHSNKLSPQNFLKKILHTVKKYHMITDGESVLVGVSGGPDSMALLHSLLEISKTLNLRIGIAHLNHGLRNHESDEDAAFVKSQADKIGLSCFIEKKDLLTDHKIKRFSIEEIGRMYRYEFFSHIALNEGFNKIAVGHHKDDNAELILLNLLRGSGTVGLCGIPPVRGNIIRPLIDTSRDEILSYLVSNQINYTIDSSNTDKRFLRNKIRVHLIPILKSQYNPNISEILTRLGMILHDEEDWHHQNLNLIVDQCTLNKNKDHITLSVDKLTNLHIAEKRRVIRQAIRHAKGNLRRISYAHTDSITRLLDNTSEVSSLDLPDKVRIQKCENQLIISQEKKSLRSAKLSGKKACPLNFEYCLSETDLFNELMIIKEINAKIRFIKLNRKDISNIKMDPSHIAFFDWDLIHFPLVIRNYRSGDRFTPLGMTGSQTLKKFFTNNKIKGLKKTRVPILLSGNKIIWVGGIRISEHFKVNKGSKTILSAELWWDDNKKSYS